MEKNQNSDNLKQRIHSIEAEHKKLWDYNCKLKDEIQRLQDANYLLNRKCDSYKYDLDCANARLQDCQDEIHGLRQVIEKATPEMNYTLQVKWICIVLIIITIFPLLLIFCIAHQIKFRIQFIVWS